MVFEGFHKGNRTFRPQAVSPLVVSPWSFRLYFSPLVVSPPYPGRVAPKPFHSLVVSPPMIENGKVFIIVSKGNSDGPILHMAWHLVGNCDLCSSSTDLLTELSFVTRTINLCNGLNDKNLVNRGKRVFLLFNYFMCNVDLVNEEYDSGYIRSAFKLMNLPVYSDSIFFKLLY